MNIFLVILLILFGSLAAYFAYNAIYKLHPREVFMTRQDDAVVSYVCLVIAVASLGCLVSHH